MAKRRKTRKEKMSSDTRRQSAPVGNVTIPSSSSLFTISDTPHHSSTQSTGATIGTSHYAYLNHDLLKTTILTVSVIIAELILKFVIKV